MQSINLRSFKQIIRLKKRRLRNFLSRLEINSFPSLDTFVVKTDKEVWKEVDCLGCANCCKTMSPTYSNKDVMRISNHLGMTQKAFREKWLYKDRAGDWINKKQPCQFLNLKTNMCSIYSVRPTDCAGFPHHTKRKVIDYIHVYKQNIEYCPATYKIVEKMMEKAATVKTDT